MIAHGALTAASPDGSGTGPTLDTLRVAGARQPGLDWASLPTTASAGFLHANLRHLLFNLLWLLPLAWVAQRWWRPATVLGVALGGSIAGHIAAAALSPGPGVGASAMVYALAALVGISGWRAAAALDVGPQRRAQALIALFVAIFALGPLRTAGVDHWAHLGGALFGAGAAALWARARAQDAMTACVALVAMAMAIGVGLQIHSVGINSTVPASIRAARSAGFEGRLVLPAAGTMGAFSTKGCRAGALDADAGLDCQNQPGAWIAVAGHPTDLLAQIPNEAHHLPPVGHCVRWTYGGETNLWIRPAADAVIALSVASDLWPETRGLRRELRRGRCL